MNKAEEILKQSKEELESKKIPTLITKGTLALENYVNDTQLKIIDVETKLECATFAFVKGDTSYIPIILEYTTDLELLKADLERVKTLQASLYKE